MLSTVGATSYWHDTTAEYGIGPLTMTGTIHVSDPPPTAITDDEIKLWLADRLDGTHLGWPTPTPSTIYAVVYPENTVVTEQSSRSCVAFGGYHSDAAPAGIGSRIIYAVLPRCAGPGLGFLDYLTNAASHELIEAVMDPMPSSNPAYQMVDDAHFPWMQLVGGGESADLCAQEPTAPFKPEGYDYTVQRSWSNVAADAGQDPCVPAVADPPYFNVSPVTPLEDVTLVFGPNDSLNVRGWDIAVDESRTFEFMLYSTAPTSDEWALEAFDLNAARSGGASALAFEFDKKTGRNGDTVRITVTATKFSATRSVATPIMVRSTLGKVQHYWLGLIHSP
jgi:hypothetical protein